MKTNTAELLFHLKNVYAEILQRNLVGIYLHGSYVFGCYNENMSDLDYLVVVKKPLSFNTKKQLMEATMKKLWSLAPAKKLEFHIVLLEESKHVARKPRFDFHFSKDHFSRYRKNPNKFIKNMKGRDLDLVTHFMIVIKFGQVLLGKPIEQVFGIVPEEYYWNSIYQDIENVQNEITREPLYCILNLCRVLAYKEEKRILSKYAGGKWAMNFLPKKYVALIEKAVKQYTDPSIAKTHYSFNELQTFASEMLVQIGRK